MNQPRSCTAIKALLVLALLCAGNFALAAQVAGTVMNLSGALLAKKGDGTVKILAVRSEVEQGDTLVSEKNTYALVKFIDNSEITLKPGTTFKIEAFAFDAGKPDGDSASFNLVKGGLRSITGLLGKRNKEKFALKTPTATIGIRGTTFIVEYVEPDAQSLAVLQAWREASTADLSAVGIAQGVVPLAPGIPGRAPGLYVQVLDGLIHVSNPAGSQSFSAGQFGFTSSFSQPPVLVPQNPGIRFTPPPAFSSSSAPGGNTAAGKSAAVDCEVR